MKLACEGSPDALSPQSAGDLARLDRLLFSGDTPVQLADAWWWIIRTEKGEAVAFGGIRPCKLTCNAGMALLTRAGVRSNYRGKGFQKRLIRARVGWAKRQGYEEVITYVMRGNNPSANALISCGFRLYEPASDYAGEKALYFRKRL